MLDAGYTGVIQVRAEHAKTASRRLIKVQPNLREWLLRHPVEGKITPQNWQKLFAEDIRRSGIHPWPNNAARHTFASMHYGKFRNAAELAAELGHASAQLVFQYYAELVRPDIAQRFWSIRPE